MTAAGVVSKLRSLRLFRLGVALVVLTLLAAGGIVVLGGVQNHVVAYFPATKSLYTGSDVRMLGVKIGSIDAIEPQGDRVKVSFHYDASRPVPADAHAVIIAPALVTSRYIQLAPGYNGGPELADGASIPLSRTEVPVEFDDIKSELDKLTTALGPDGANQTGALGRLLDTAASYQGQGQSFHDTIDQVSRAIQTLSDGRTDLFGTLRNLDVFVSALSASDQQIVQFTDRLDTVAGTLDDNRRQLADALSSLDVAAGDVTKFLQDNRGQLKDATSTLTDVVRNLSQQRPALEEALHVAPTAITNFYNVYDPLGGSYTGTAALTNLQNPAQFVCSGIGAATATTPAEAGKLCSDTLGPLLNLLQMNYPPVSVDALTRQGAPVAPPVGQQEAHQGDLSSAHELLGDQPLSETLRQLLNPAGGH
ncbi:MCE family protein [Amycolatopsis acidicola]|uniref:MCE family protein n=1 Tax=Amycolatopsis acidicola TaxID=2596893 RepID=UPI00140C6061|nr:MCE family protein [Amycolatopsis acidicola]